MDDQIRGLLDEKIVTELGNLSSSHLEGDKKSGALDRLVTLHRLRIEEAKIQLEADEKREKRIIEDNQLVEQVKDRYFRLGIAVAEIVVPLVFYAVWMRMGFKFEENGTFTSTTFKGLFNRFKPTKK